MELGIGLSISNIPRTVSMATVNGRSDNGVALSAGANPILFAAVGGDFAPRYDVSPFAYNAAGNWQAVKITNRTSAGFTATVTNPGFLDYIAKQKTT